MQVLLYELLEILKKLFVTIFGGYHVKCGDDFLYAMEVNMFDRIIFIGIAAALLLSIWIPRIIKTSSKTVKVTAEVIIHLIIVGMIIWEAVGHEKYIRGIILLMLYLLFELSRELFLSQHKRKKEILTVKNHKK